jgi:hypothetical protein
MVDDFYLNLLSWSVQNVVAVALAENTYIWKADSGDVVQIGEAPEGTYVSSVDFSNDGSFLGIGIGSGDVELWDVESGQKLRSMGGHQAQIAVLSWHGHILSSACGDGSIWHHDVRVARHKVMELLGHSGEVCGLEWRADGELLASGGNDNVVNIWDGRVGDVTEGSRGVARWTKRNHSAAVKVLYHVFIFIQFLLFRTVSFSFFFFFISVGRRLFMLKVLSAPFFFFNRLLRGAHGSHPFWRVAAARTMPRSTFGIARREEDCIH